MDQAIKALQKLKVIDRMEIGPVYLEKNRLRSKYKIIQGKNEDSTTLEYRYEEKVFLPDELESINLANMIGAQVAINYGLFCKEIVFHGYFDVLDQTFILNMAANTAQEIYVKKFLEYNPFLKETVSGLSPVKLDNYLQASINFTENYQQTNSHWKVDNSSYCILSSGGKDSLLSYSLLKELGYETHPIFVNESGRHWFTALNAYRYFKNQYNETARVWTNSDRIFAWMLRHLPFIKTNFSQIRSDEYPIRLWTVAVFLFGVLPILRKRGIRHLIIGDEFDTTRYVNFKGIPHYDGLFDQSRYFDNDMTRFFIQKDWNIRQFSILRPLSEMLIQKILATRYHDHLKQQMSCHAAHIQGDRVYPCGYCEKCRRIVGMLKAIDIDPSNCGYNDQQVTNCLNAISEKGVYQEQEGAKHLIYLLTQKHLINNLINVKSYNEIMKLRIDAEASPIHDIPEKLREPLYKIFLEYAEGALKKEKMDWIEFDIFSSPDMLKPYPFH